SVVGASIVPRKCHRPNEPGKSFPILSTSAASTLSTAALSPFIAAVMQKAKIASLPTLCTVPFLSFSGGSLGVIPSAGISASPARCAVINAVISSQPIEFAMNASGSTCTIARLSGSLRFFSSAISVIIYSPICQCCFSDKCCLLSFRAAWSITYFGLDRPDIISGRSDRVRITGDESVCRTIGIERMTKDLPDVSPIDMNADGNALGESVGQLHGFPIFGRDNIDRTGFGEFGIALGPRRTARLPWEVLSAPGAAQQTADFPDPVFANRHSLASMKNSADHR